MSREALEGGSGRIDSSVSYYFDLFETYLGEMRGNEAAWEVVEEEERWIADGQRENLAESTGAVIYGGVQIPGTYNFRMQFRALSGEGESGARPDGRTDGVEAAVEEKILAAWKAASGTVKGLAQSYRSTTATVWKPDVGALRGAVAQAETVSNALAQYLGVTSPDFVRDLHRSWPPSSLGSDSFYDFWEDIGDFCSQLLHGSNAFAVISAVSTAAIERHQDNLVDISEAAVDSLAQALGYWQHFESPDWQVTTTVANDGLSDEVLGGVSTASGLLALLPGPQSLALDVTSLASGILGHYAATESKTVEIAYVESSVAGPDFRDALDRCSTELNTALDHASSQPLFNPSSSELHSGSSGDGAVDFPAFADACESNANWKPVHVEIPNA